MESQELRQKFLMFFKERGHTVIPSASLVPEGDTTTLFISSGMQPLMKNLLGERHPGGVRLVNSQKSFRAEDIDEVGDNRHTTFFEMLGNWSFGDYFKEEQLTWYFEFLTKEVGLDPKKLYVTVFAGDQENNVPRDDESVATWKRLFKGKGIEAKDVELVTEKRAGEKGMQSGRIFYYRDKNWWSRAGAPANMPPREPGGPDSEVFYEFTDVPHDEKYGKCCHPNCDCGRFMEIGNSVFMEYIKREDGTFEKLKQQNVDFGGGLERMLAAANNDADMFHIDLLKPLIELLPDTLDIRKKRIVADHLRATTFLTADSVRPSNKGSGYVLRRLMRRVMTYEYVHQIPPHVFDAIIHDIVHEYGELYPELLRENETIREEFKKERRKFDEVERTTTEAVVKKFIDKSKNETDRQNLVRLLKELKNEKRSKLPSGEIVRGEGFNAIPFQDLLDTYQLSGKEAFDLYQSTGASLELISQLAKRYFNFDVDEEGFWQEFKKHQEISRAGQEKKFGGHGLLLDTGELKAADEEELKKVTRLHTATHLLNAALHKVLGDSVVQNGSDITAERTRFDFNFL